MWLENVPGFNRAEAIGDKEDGNIESADKNSLDSLAARRALRLLGKCFTCVTKTIANLATYGRKPENYNGNIIFEFDMMKNSSPINLNLCQN